MADRGAEPGAGRRAASAGLARADASVAPARAGALAALAVLVVAVALAGAFLLAPPLGTDLSAQVARANFFARHGFAPVDFGWYGGISPYGYSLLTPPLMSWAGTDAIGPRVVGAVALVVSALALLATLRRTAARRPLLGGLLGAGCIAGNLVSGRITYAVGVAFGLLAVLALTAPVGRWWRRPAAGASALLATAASPVAGLFVGLAGAALVAGAAGRRSGGAGRGRGRGGDAGRSGGRGRARRYDGAVLALAAGVPMLGLAVLFGAGGWMNISLLDAVRAVAASLVVAALVPRRPVRFGALLSALGVVAAYAVHTPVGLNATRLAAMFALPLIAAYGTVPARLSPRGIPGRRPASTGTAGAGAGASAGRWAGAVLAAGLLLVALVQPPVSVPDLRRAGDPTASRDYFQPLLDELARRAPARVEVVPTGNYWEAAYVPEAAPLARGWLRQADQAHHRLFLDGSLDAETYADWLRRNGVGYVALAGAEPSWVGRREAELIRAGQPYLTPVWQHPDWILYAVREPTSIVDDSGPAGAELVSADPAGLTVELPTAGEVMVRVRWSRWLRVSGGPACLTPHGEWSMLRVSRPGTYRITGSVTGAGPHCPS